MPVRRFSGSIPTHSTVRVARRIEVSIYYGGKAASQARRVRGQAIFGKPNLKIFTLLKLILDVTYLTVVSIPSRKGGQKTKLKNN